MGDRQLSARGVARCAATVTLWCLLLLGSYGAAGLIGGAIPSNPRWRPPARGITIYVETNGIHTDLIVPKVAAGVDWRDLARPGDLRDPRYAGWDHLAIGWGERAFYLGTPHWRDLRLGTVLHAAIGSGATLVHVEHLPAPAPAADIRPIVLRPDEYRRLADYIRASLAFHGGSRPAHRWGYDVFDAFYDGRGRYSAVGTCNAWTGDALRYAGVRVGAWTPFPITVMGWF